MEEGAWTGREAESAVSALIHLQHHRDVHGVQRYQQTAAPPLQQTSG